jgi:ABC-type uncharacterized transport system permease subunit
MSHSPHIMANPALNFLALALYVAAAILIAQRLASGRPASPGAKIGTLSLTLGAIILHAAILYTGFLSGGGVNLSLTAAFSLVAWIVAAMYFVVSLFRPLDSLGILITPLAALTVLAAALWPAQNLITLSTPWQAAHIVVALLAYSLLCLAAAQSLLLLVQERELKHRHPGGILRALPPMELTETLMFHLIGVGFVLLTLTVVSGIFFAEQFFGKPFSFTHHIVLALCAWVVYAVLLFGRWRLGWRGRTAVRWTLGGFMLLVLAYFGTKFVLEVLLGRV